VTLDRREQSFNTKRLAQAQYSADFVGALLLTTARCQKYRWRHRLFVLSAHGFKNALAIHSRHRVIEQYERRQMLSRGFQGCDAAAGFDDRVPLASQYSRERPPQGWVVIDYQYGIVIRHDATVASPPCRIEMNRGVRRFRGVIAYTE
jgi:hypothetical protein